MRIASFFAGAGGLDLGFRNAGFDVVWANEYDQHIWDTYTFNHPHTKLDRRSITEISSEDVPDEIDGIIGGPPCQSWSAAGALRGISDSRGQLFYDFIRILKDKQPKFFLAENVAGMLSKRHEKALEHIKKMFVDAGYHLSFKLLNAADYGVPQDRKRVFFVGYRDDLNLKFVFPGPWDKRYTLKDSIADLAGKAKPALNSTYSNGEGCEIPNHEYLEGSFSSKYMSRNRVREMDEVSFTIQAGGRHAPLHPQAPKMEWIAQDVRRFVPGKEHLYRRLSVRECARIQTFPDDFIFIYKNVNAGYKMIGNAVPVKLAEILGNQIKQDLLHYFIPKADQKAKVKATIHL